MRERSRGLLAAGLGLLLAGAAPADDERSLADTGRDAYLNYCASCHGLSGRGDGPVADALSKRPADLTQLGGKYGIPLPEEQLAEFIDGRRDVAAHGTRVMPVWGARLYEGEIRGSPHLESAKRGAILLIIKYLARIQRPAETEP